MMDLLGADLPVNGSAPGQFTWSDGPLLRALRAGEWVILDEINLAGAFLPVQVLSQAPFKHIRLL